MNRGYNLLAFPHGGYLIREKKGGVDTREDNEASEALIEGKSNAGPKTDQNTERSQRLKMSPGLHSNYANTLSQFSPCMQIRTKHKVQLSLMGISLVLQLFLDNQQFIHPPGPLCSVSKLAKLAVMSRLWDAAHRHLIPEKTNSCFSTFI